MQLTVYTFDDESGPDANGWSTQDYDEAKRYAQDRNLQIIANNYEFVDSEPLEDYRFTPAPDNDPELSDEEVRLSHCHGSGTLDMLKCRECNQALGDAHLADCPIAREQAPISTAEAVSAFVAGVFGNPNFNGAR